MRDRSAIFLDLDGVLVDNGPALHAAFRRGVSEALHARFGGDLEAWAKAHDEAYANAPMPPLDRHPLAMYAWENVVGISGPCRLMGVTPPPEDECATWGDEVDRRVRLELASFLPGVGEAVRMLQATRALHMSSGNASWIVEGSLERLGVREHVGVPCGADLVGVAKPLDAFYPAVFAAAGVEARDAIVVDDGPAHLARAKRAGAVTVLIANHVPDAPLEGVDLVLPSLADLAAALA